MTKERKHNHRNRRERRAIVYTNGISEKKAHSCVVIGGTKSHWHIRVNQDTRFPNKFVKAGECTFVPKFAVKVIDNDN